MNEKVEEYTNLAVDFEAIKLSVFPPRIDLFGVQIAPSNARTKNIVRANKITAQLSISALFWGEVRLSYIKSDDLQAVWPPPFGFPGFIKDSGPEPTQSSTPALTWPLDFDLPVDNIRITNGSLYFETPTNNEVPLAPNYLTMSLVGVDLDFNYEGWADTDLHTEIQYANASLGPNSIIEDTKIDAIIETARDKITITRILTAGERLNLDANGILTLEKESRKSSSVKSMLLEVRSRAQGDLSLLGSALDLEETRGPFEGTIATRVQLPMDPSSKPAYEINVDAGVEDSLFYGFRLFDSLVDLTITSEKIQFNKIDVQLDGTSFGLAEGVLNFDEKTTYDFNIKPDSLRLMDLLSAFQVDFNVLDTGITSDNLKLKGTSDPFEMDISATALFDEFTTPATPFDQTRYPLSPACALAVKMRVTSDLLDILPTNGNCYIPANNKDNLPPGTVQAPKGTNHVSPLNLVGPVYFNDQKGIDLKVSSESLELGMANYFAQTPLNGQTSLMARIHGPYSNVLIDVNVAASGVEVDSIPLNSINAALRVDGSKIAWKDLKLLADAGGEITSPSGHLVIDDAYSFDATIRAREINAEYFSRILGSPAIGVNFGFGVQSLDAELSGPLKFPGAWTGTVSGALTSLTQENNLLASTMSINLVSTEAGITLSNSVLGIETLRLKLGLSHKRAFPFSLEESLLVNNPWTRLGLHPDDTFVFEFETLESESTDGIDHLAALPYVGTTVKNIGIASNINLNGKITGDTENIQGTFSGELEQPVIFGSRISNFELRGFINNSNLDLMLSHSGNSLEGRLNLNLMEDGTPYEWFFSMNRFDLRAFCTELFYNDPRNYAYISADWSMKGKFGDWWRSTGKLNVNDLRLKYVQDVGASTKNLQIKQERPVSVLFDNDGWSIEEEDELHLTGRYFDFRLAIPKSRPPDNIDFNLSSIVDVEVAKAFLQDIDSAAGKIKIDASIKGSVEKPDISVKVQDLKQNPFIAATWQPVKIGLANLRPPLTNIRIDANYTNGVLSLDTFKANKGAGTVNANGSMSFGDTSQTETRLDISFNDATIVYPVAVLKSFESQISGTVSVSGKDLPYRINGDVNITKARAVQEVDIRDEIINALRKQSFVGGTIEAKPNILFDLNITADKTINIHNRNLQTNLSTDIQIKGTDIQPIVLGQVEVNRGKFIYKRDFTLSRGVVTFDDPVKPDPSLDILAYSDISSYRVYISITGRASNPVVEFSADPPTTESGQPISKEEILVLISRGSLPESGRSVGVDLQTAATSEALNLIMGQFEEPVEKLFDLTGQSWVRNVYVDTYPSEEGPVPRLNLPLDLGNEFDVVIRWDQTTTQYSLEYPVHENISMSGSVENKRDDSEAAANSGPANAKVDLRFRFSFE